jgi:beta-galactosidase
MTTAVPPGLLYGCAYYHEYMPHERLAEDIRLMREAGVNFVRLGESTWSSWEPQEGVFETAWIDRVLDAMHAAGIRVMVGTPTYAVPPWLVRAHPDILVTTFKGQVGYGGRQNMDIVHPVYRERAERIIRFVVEHVRDHPAVFAYQVDNETKAYHTASAHARRLFVERLRAKFGTPEMLNQAWNLTYWSQRITSWDEFIVSGDWTNPSTLLEWRRFQQQLATEFIGWQAGLVRDLRRPGQLITHNFDFHFKRDENAGPNPDVDHFSAAPALDVAGIDIYHTYQDRFDGSLIAFGGDWTRSLLGGRNYYVLETNAQSTGLALGQCPPYDGQFRQAAFAHVAHGANLVAYWHWHSCHAGNEIYWRGILGHDLEPNRVYAEFSRTARELAQLGPRLADLRINSEVAILHSQDSNSALLDRPFSPDTTHAEWTLALYRACFRRSTAVDFVPPASGRLARYKLVIVPALYIATDAALEELAAYVEGGGHVVLTFKSGFANEHHYVRPVRMPGRLRALAGISYQEFSNTGRLPLCHAFPDVAPADSYAGEFVEFLQAEGAVALASYDHPFFGRFPAITRYRATATAGVVTYLGSVLSAAMLEAVLADSAREAGVAAAPAAWRAPLFWRTGVNAAGRRVHYGFNFSAAPRSASLPLAGAATLLPEDRPLAPGEAVLLNPWDVVIAEENG